MPTLALTDAFCYVDGYDFTSDTNELRLTAEGDELDKTTFGSGGWREFAVGLKRANLEMAGFWQSDTDAVDPQAFNNLGVPGRVVTLGDLDTETTPAVGFQLIQMRYEFLGPLGQLAPFRLAGSGSDGVGVVHGQLAKAKGAVSGTGQLGSILNLGAPTSTQFVYATVNIFSAGTTITILLESDTAAGFTTPTTRATIGPLTTTGGTWMTRVAGPFAGETHWRFNVSTISGTFTVAGLIAVQ